MKGSVGVNFITRLLQSKIPVLVISFGVIWFVIGVVVILSSEREITRQLDTISRVIRATKSLRYARNEFLSNDLAKSSEFYKTGKSEAVRNVDDLLDNMKRDVAELKKTNIARERSFKDIIFSIHLLEITWEKMVRQYLLIGNEKYGLVEKWSTAIHQVGKRITQLGYPALVNAYQTIRKHEKDLLIGFEKQRLFILQEEVDRIKRLFSSLPVDEKYLLEKLVNAYITNFIAHMDYRKAVGLTSNLGLKGQVNQLLIKIDTNLLEVFSLHSMSTRGILKMYVLVLAASLLLVLWFSWYVLSTISKNIYFPIRQINEAAAKLEEGNLDVSLDLQSANEVKHLADAFNRLLNNFRQKIGNAEIEIKQRDAESEAIFNAAVLGIVNFDEIGIIQKFNPAAEQLFGYQSSEIVGENIGVLLDIPEGEHAVEFLKHRLLGKSGRRIDSENELEGKHVSRRIFPILVSLGEMLLDNKVSYMGLIQDISHRKRSELERRSALEYAENLVQGITIPILVLDKDFFIQTANYAFLSFFRSSKTLIQGKQFFDLQGGSWGENELVDYLKAVFKKKTERRALGVRIKFPHIGEKELNIMASQTVQKSNSEPMILLVIRDITDEKMFEGNLIKTNSLLEEQNKIKSALAELGQILRGEDNIENLGNQSLFFLISSLNAQVGAFYVANGNKLIRNSSYSYDSNLKAPNHFLIGEGLVGQVAQQEKPIIIRDVPKNYLSIRSSLGDLFPNQLLIQPVLFEGKVLAVIEIGTMYHFTDEDVKYIALAAESIGISLQSAQSRSQLTSLLEKTKDQAETLMQQQLELRKKQMELVLKAKDLEKASRYKSEFLANMSHELRTPLNSLLILSNSLSKNEPGNLLDDQVNALKIIHSGGKELLELINDILDLSKVEAGKLSVFESETNLEEILKKIQGSFAPVAASKGIDLIVTLDERLPPFLFTDGKRLSQILRNLLSNGIKFTATGFVKLNVRYVKDLVAGVNLKETELVAFEVVDSGIGVPPDKQEIIFNAFQQADGSTSRRYGGTGLGLSISKELSRLLHGNIIMQSMVDRGSIFTLYIPLRRQASLLGELLPLNGVNQQASDVVLGSKSIPVPLAGKDQLKTGSANVDGQNGSASEHIPAREFSDELLFISNQEIVPDYFSDLAQVRKVSIKAIAQVDDLKTYMDNHIPRGIFYLLPRAEPGGDAVKNVFDYLRGIDDVPVMIGGLPSEKTIDSLSYLDNIVYKTWGEIDEIAVKSVFDYFLDVGVATKLANKRLLIVDDDMRNIYSLSHEFKRFNIIVDVAENGVRALEQIEKNSDIDLVLMDIMMPVMDGFTAIKEIRGRPGFLHLPIIALTANNLNEDRKKCIAVGASDYLAKPIVVPDLIRLIKRCFLRKFNLSYNGSDHGNQTKNLAS